MGKININKFVDKMMEMTPKFGQRFKFKPNKDILKLDLGVPHMMVMNIIATSKTPPILSEIAEMLSISYPMMTHIIDRMESKKLLHRVRDTRDRRIIKVDLTERGKEVLKKFRAEHKEHMTSFLGVLSKTDRKSFIKAMDTIFKVVMKYKDSQS